MEHNLKTVTIRTPDRRSCKANQERQRMRVDALERCDMTNGTNGSENG